ncbi:hypothetical protein X798_05641 [Onchocerca flexuosa]|uniref:GMPS ATP-PPase domain-containing protein n=1 Tax=Onchocerca flexuosa TaxID=387005 RepID=A0A238BPM2_9BILA|nr:hypothetical protein X798_05641 [Onchocerca flexuosa]
MQPIFCYFPHDLCDVSRKKRKIIGGTSIEVFEEAKEIGNVDFLTQGTICSDVVESGYASTIKSHHNVGRLPKKK